jgi:Coenzyme PQQ synthesis protein D (PqqD)
LYRKKVGYHAGSMPQPISHTASVADQPFRRAEGVETTVVGDRSVLYHKTRGTAVVLNPTGSVLWGRLERPQRIGDLVRALMERHGHLAAERAESDVAAFVNELSAQNLLVRATA